MGIRWVVKDERSVNNQKVRRKFYAMHGTTQYIVPTGLLQPYGKRREKDGGHILYPEGTAVLGSGRASGVFVFKRRGGCTWCGRGVGV